MGKSQDLYIKAKGLIPGGTQLLTKRPEMFLPDSWPSYYSMAKGFTVWDLDGNAYSDMSYMGIGANVLGYCDPEVNSAVKTAVDNSSMCTLNAPEEVELAELLIELHPWAEMVRYSKSGGEAMSIAVRIARAFTGKETVLFCGYHGWCDWYLAANLNISDALDTHLIKGLNPNGVPRGLAGTSIPFNYNNIDEFKQLIDHNKGRIAAVIMEPIRNSYPNNRFLETIREITEKEQIVLIFDEITSGFRLSCGGAHRVLGVNPDIAVFGKAMSNGYPMAAIIGKKMIMQAAQDTFISSTYWTDRIGLAASIASIKKFKDNAVEGHLSRIGKDIQEGWKMIADKLGLKLHVTGIYPLGHFDFVYDNALELKTIFTQEMLKRGYLATNAFYASFMHNDEIVRKYLEDTEHVFALIKTHIDKNSIKDLLDGEVCQTGFQRLT